MVLVFSVRNSMLPFEGNEREILAWILETLSYFMLIVTEFSTTHGNSHLKLTMGWAVISKQIKKCSGILSLLSTKIDWSVLFINWLYIISSMRNHLYTWFIRIYFELKVSKALPSSCWQRNPCVTHSIMQPYSLNTAALSGDNVITKVPRSRGHPQLKAVARWALIW